MTFSITEFIKTNLIDGVKNGSFTREHANVKAVDYLTKNILSQADVQEIDAATAPEPQVLSWMAGEWVEMGDKRTYGGVLYECRQPHTTQAGFEPPIAPALWSEVTM